MSKTAQIGSVSHGTMREEDLIVPFADLLAEARSLEWDDEADEYVQDDIGTPGEVLHALFDALGNYAPDFCYFGAHPGDGSDYGFWVCEDAQEMVRDNGGLIVSDTSEVPEDFNEYVLHVNDHGNMTLYFASAGKLREIWAIV